MQEHIKSVNDLQDKSYKKLVRENEDLNRQIYHVYASENSLLLSIFL